MLHDESTSLEEHLPCAIGDVFQHIVHHGHVTNLFHTDQLATLVTCKCGQWWEDQRNPFNHCPHFPQGVTVTMLVQFAHCHTTTTSAQRRVNKHKY